jgi:glycosyltransferase involved in cell wall biosynthesis
VKILYHHRTAAADGQYVHIRELTDAMDALGHDVVFVGPGRSRRRTLDAGDTATRNPPSRLARAARELLELAYTIPAFLRLWRSYLRTRPDVLYERSNLFFLSGLWLKRLTGVPYLLEVNAPLAQERTQHGTLFWQRLARRTEEAVWRGADHCFPVTNVLADHLRAAGVPDDRITVVQNGVGDAFLSELVENGPVGGIEGRVVLGFTGFIRDWHGLDRVVDLIGEQGESMNLHFVVVGDGPARVALEQQARDQGVSERVTFTGVVQRDEIPAHVAQFDIALQPDVVAYASPLKLFEYMALGKAIVAPDTPNIGEVLSHNRNARLFPPGDEDAFCVQVEQLSMDAPLRRRLGSAARQTIIDDDYSWRGNAARVVAVAQRLISS